MKGLRIDVKMVYDEQSHSVVVLNENSVAELPNPKPLTMGGMVICEPTPTLKEYVFNFYNVNNTLDKAIVFDKKSILKLIGDIVIVCIPLRFNINNQDFLQNELVRLIKLRDDRYNGWYYFIQRIEDSYTITINVFDGSVRTVIDFRFKEIPLNILIRLLRVFIRRHNVRHKHFEGMVS